MEVLLQRGLRTCPMLLKCHRVSQVRTRRYGKKEPENSCKRALQYFDATYPAVYGEQWPSVRLGLLCQHKYVAILNNAAPSFNQTLYDFKEMGAMDVGPLYRENCRRLLAEQGEARLQSTQCTEGDEDVAAKHVDQQQHRVPMKEMDDEQLAELALEPPLARYPPQYCQGSVVQPSGTPAPPSLSDDRLLLPTAHAVAHPMQDFIPADRLMGLDDWVEESDVFLKNRITTQPGEGPGVNIQETQEFIEWPEMLTVMAFPRSMVADFPPPWQDHGLSSHYLLDGGSVLPVLLLGLQASDTVLDSCAAPGGKTFIALQTCLPGLVQSNDMSPSRARRVRSVVEQFYSSSSSLIRAHFVTQQDARMQFDGSSSEGYSGFDKVLVDVPCLSDRHVLQDADNSIFRKSRTKERLSMPEIQAELLVAAIRNVRVGGSVVYSTCTLSAMQNDGVVHLALNRLWDNTDIQCDVVDYSSILRPFDFVYKFAEELGMKYGQLVIPWLPNNYGPMYCAKLVRTK